MRQTVGTDSLYVNDAVSDRLRMALLDEEYFLKSFRKAPHEPHPDQTGHLQLTSYLAVRRALDLETAEFRTVRVSVRRTDQGLEIYEVDGLGLKDLGD